MLTIRSFGFPVTLKQPINVINFSPEIVPCNSEFLSNISSPLNCTSDLGPKKQISSSLLALEVIGPLSLIAALIYILVEWKNRRKKATVAPQTLAPAFDVIAGSQQQPTIISQPLPAARTLPDLTNQIKRQGDHPTARGGYSDIFTALWHINAEAQQISNTETDIPVEVRVKVAIKALRLSSTDETKVNRVRMSHTPISITLTLMP